jgi:hypothetical protein
MPPFVTAASLLTAYDGIVLAHRTVEPGGSMRYRINAHRHVLTCSIGHAAPANRGGGDLPAALHEDLLRLAGQRRWQQQQPQRRVCDDQELQQHDPKSDRLHDSGQGQPRLHVRHLLPRVPASVRIHTGKGTNTSTDRYWGRSWYVWNNTGDKAYLRNPDFVLRDSCEWGDGIGYIWC